MAKAIEELTIPIRVENLDQAIEKANRLVELLREAQQIIDSLSCEKLIS